MILFSRTQTQKKRPKPLLLSVCCFEWKPDSPDCTQHRAGQPTRHPADQSCRAAGAAGRFLAHELLIGSVVGNILVWVAALLEEVLQLSRISLGNIKAAQYGAVFKTADTEVEQGNGEDTT